MTKKNEMPRISCVTVQNGRHQPYTVDLNDFGKDIVTFGRGAENDLVLPCMLVSYTHGRFVREGDAWVIEDRGAYDIPSTNGTFYKGDYMDRHKIKDGDVILVGTPPENWQVDRTQGICLHFSAPPDGKK